ncbi:MULTISPECIES: hypothetical protein [Crocosphaera]|nr:MULTISPECIES: hypothetical protein [Crocosphaera]MCH2246957.1 hypothetical protein [Crocosphaera sp.]CCQ55100.1 hypothetical protein CWATWH0005_3745 [Crocosphaera watsonii WH 0005]
MLGIVISYYWAVALLIFSMWFKLFWADETTPRNDLSSWVVLIVGASLWVVVLPFANLELVLKAYSINS